MKYVSFPGAEVLTGVADMLECLGHDTDDRTIALGMNAPWLLMKEGDRYLSGMALFQPRWIDMYLLPHGFHLVETLLPCNQLPAFLRSRSAAMFTASMAKDANHPIVFTGYEDSHYSFINVKPVMSGEPDRFHLTAPMLKRRLSEQVRVWTLETCPPQQVDFIPLFVLTLDNLRSYQADIQSTLGQAVSRDELCALYVRLFRALIADLPPMIMLANDLYLLERLRLLNHDYRHVFTQNSPNRVLLQDRLPRSEIRECLAWYREDVVDQLYQCGLEDDEVERILSAHR